MAYRRERDEVAVLLAIKPHRIPTSLGPRCRISYEPTSG